MSAKAQTISLHEAAERLGVHYMTAYKYVRTGKLPATKEGVEWRVLPSDVAKLARKPKRPPRAGRPRDHALPRLQDRLVAGDEAGAWAVLEGALSSGAEPAELYTDLLVPAMRWVGEGWAKGSVSVAQEHRAAAVALRLVGRLGPRFARRGRRRGGVVVGAPAGELHGLPVAIVADLLRAAGFEVADLGPNTPSESFVEACRATPRLVAVAMCITTSLPERALVEAVESIRRARIETPVLVGGAAVADAGHARRLGADGWTGHDAASAVASVEACLARRENHGR